MYAPTLRPPSRPDGFFRYGIVTFDKNAWSSRDFSRLSLAPRVPSCRLSQSPPSVLSVLCVICVRPIYAPPIPALPRATVAVPLPHPSQPLISRANRHAPIPEPIAPAFDSEIRLHRLSSAARVVSSLLIGLSTPARTKHGENRADTTPDTNPHPSHRTDRTRRLTRVFYPD